MTHNSNKIVDAQQHYRQSSTQQSASIYRGMAGWTHWKLSRFLVTMVSMSRSKTLFSLGCSSLWELECSYAAHRRVTSQRLILVMWWHVFAFVSLQLHQYIKICPYPKVNLSKISASLFAAIRIFLVASNQVIFKSFKIFVTHSILWTYE